LKKTCALLLACIIMVSSTTAMSQTRRRSATKRSAGAAKAAEKSSAEIKAGAAQVAAQIKTLTHFVYLLGGIVKGIESADKATGNHDASAPTIEQNERNKTKVKESIRSVREGLDKLESDFRFHPTLKSYYPYLAGVARIGEAAENQAAANRFDEAGRSLLKAIDQLTDALAAMR
jgi:uncharacterized phage infection (PIP) family protein YhgE